MKIKYEFQSIESLQLENSFTVLKSQENVKLHCTVGINDDNYGWFEIYDEESSGENWYAEGGLWFENKKVTDYDGVFAIPNGIITKLEELGYDCQDIK